MPWWQSLAPYWEVVLDWPPIVLGLASGVVTVVATPAARMTRSAATHRCDSLLEKQTSAAKLSG